MRPRRAPAASAICATLLAGLVAGAAAAPRYGMIDRIAGPDGRYDYISVDSAARRLFVGRGDGVMAIDLATRRVTPAFVPGRGVAAVLLLPGGGMLSTNGDSDTATIARRSDGRVLGEVATGRDPDGAAYDPRSGLAFVMNGDSHDVTMIDPARRARIATIPVGGKPEAAVADGRGSLFVNIEDRAETVRIDIARRAVVARYPLRRCDEPTGLAHDPASGMLIAACHNGIAKLIDAATGADRGGFAIGRMADGAVWDATRRLIHVPCNDGTLTIARLDRRGSAHPVATVRSRIGARTAALDPRDGRLYLPAADYRPGPDGAPMRVPGSFGVLVVAPLSKTAR